MKKFERSPSGWPQRFSLKNLSKSLFKNRKVITRPSASPPKEIPTEFLSRFTMDGKVKVEKLYIDSSNSSQKTRIYTEEMITRYIEEAGEKKTQYYKKTDLDLYNVLEKYDIGSKTVAIMGSQTPWYESICISYGGNPTTIEYNELISKDHRLKVITVEEYNKSPFQFDIGLSISSFEHEGLGRYGDPVSPDADLEAMEKMKSTIKKGGLLFLAVPIGLDAVVWNAHRIYGEIRLPLLLKGWKLIDSFGFDKELVHRDIGKGWDTSLPDYPSYQPALVWENI